MQSQITQWAAAIILAAGTSGLLAGCASSRTRTDLSEAARATVDRLTADGQVEKINQETERGRVVYDVEATVGGQHVEYVIAHDDGAVLGTETPIAWSELPDAVRAAAEQHFGSTTGLTAWKGVEYDETSYEIEGLRNGRRSEVSFDPAGQRTE